jgi:hypothetical protein
MRQLRHAEILDQRLACSALPRLEIYAGFLSVTDAQRERSAPVDARPAVDRRAYLGARGTIPEDDTFSGAAVRPTGDEQRAELFAFGKRNGSASRMRRLVGPRVIKRKLRDGGYFWQFSRLSKLNSAVSCRAQGSGSP